MKQPETPPKLVVLFGPTAVGKSDLLLSVLDERFEIVSADAFQVYLGMDIGTAKPTPQERARLPHHLVDIVEPSDQYNAGEFVHRAEAAAAAIRSRGRIPVVSGGSAFYLRNLLYGLPESPRGDPTVRRKLQELERECGPAHLRALLEERDPLAASRIPPADRYRTVRALEVLETTGRSVYSFAWPGRQRGDQDLLVIGLDRPREELYRRIEERVDLMFARGLVEEVRRLLAAGYGPVAPGLRGIGYREFMAMRKGCLGFPEVRALIKRNSRHYAKRQLTFFRSLPAVRWMDADDREGVRTAIEEFIAP